MEISPFKITFEYIKGVKNTLADTMSTLMSIKPDDLQEPKHPGHEFDYYVFESLPKIEPKYSP